MTGYLHSGYAQSLEEFGTPRYLPHSKGWVLQRPVGDSGDQDAMGPYPLLCCQDWGEIGRDLTDLRGEIVSLTGVTDPFGNFDEAALRDRFDVVTPFKAHFLVDLSRNPLGTISKHHRYYSRQALGSIKVEPAEHPRSYLDCWIELYDVLIRRHNLRGMKAFSREAFGRQFAVPGFVMLRAESRGETVGMHLWYVQGDVAYSHLMALSERGYELPTSYALYHRAIEFFGADGPRPVQWMDLGSGAGLAGADDGLTRFKRGWANSSRMAYLVGKIVDPVRYQQLAAERNASTSSYFPAYRCGEFA